MVNALQTILIIAALKSSFFARVAERYDVDPAVLEGICRYESDSGRSKSRRNKNGTWDVGYCQNHGYSKSDEVPEIPSNRASVREAAKELRYWRKQHSRFCEKLYTETGKCGEVRSGKWRGVKNCHRPHPWWGHYNWGFRVLTNNYDRKVQCFIDNGFKKCKKKRWREVKF